MTKKIFHSILIACVAILAATIAIIMSCLVNYFGTVQQNQLKDSLSLASTAVEQQGMEYLENLESGRYRLTWIAADGEILFDNQASKKEMDNHSNREEVMEADRTGYGESARYSSTLFEKTYYIANRLSDGSVLRISCSQASAAVLLAGMIQPILIMLILALALGATLAHRLAGRITAPLNSLDLDHPLENDTYDELSPLLHRIHAQHVQISQQWKQLQRSKDEFDQITANMKEGFLLLNVENQIVSINSSACQLFDTSPDCTGQDLITIERNPEFSQAYEQCQKSGHEQLLQEREGRQIQFEMNRIASQGVPVGTAVLAFDVTDQVNAEKNRREFTANVSHELKTPLQSIMGSAELIEQGLVKVEDMPRFIGSIRKEAGRLLTLIEDILRLSFMDENARFTMEPVDLGELATKIVAAFQPAAEKASVHLNVRAESVQMQGCRNLLSEIISNLVENAINYNRPDGTVDVTVSENDNRVVLKVRDSGIGIPAQQLSRIYERFYRVDKSHSRKSGGTGLGLSIVKHAVKIHHGDIEVSSFLGQGTEFTVTFDKRQEN